VLTGLAATYLLGPLGVEAHVVELARAYVLGNAPGVLAFCAFLAGRNFLQAHGTTRPIVVASVVANAINLVVSVPLVGGDDFLVRMGLPAIGLPGLGALGAGLGTSIASFVLAAV